MENQPIKLLINADSLPKKYVCHFKAFIYFLLAFLISFCFVIVLPYLQQGGLTVHIESNARYYQLFYDSGNGFSEFETMQSSNDFFLPLKKIRRIRIDPMPPENCSTVTINKIAISGNGFEKCILQKELLEFLLPLNHISSITFDPISQSANLKISGIDPSLILNIQEKELLKYTSFLNPCKRIGMKQTIIFFLLMTFFYGLWTLRKRLMRGLNWLNRYIDGIDDHELTPDASNTQESLVTRIIDPFTSMKTYWRIFFISSIACMICYSGVNANLSTTARYDDALFFKQAISILHGNWLGGYHQLTLSKVPGFAIFLAGCIATRLPYFLIITLCNSIAIAFLLRNTLWLFKGARLLSLIMGIILLFSPLFAFAGELRIYRNQLTAICLLIFIGVLASIFNPHTEKNSGIKKLIEAIIAFLGMGFLFYLREESSLYYLIIGLSIVLFILISGRIQSIRRNLYLLFSGIIGIITIGVLICSLNYHYYGRFITCERTSPPYTSVLKAFQKVDDPGLNKQFPLMSSTREKILKIAEVVPEFKKMASIMCDPKNNAFKDCSIYFDKNEMRYKYTGKDDLPASHFEWFWPECANRAGYYKNASTIASFYQTVTKGINEGLKNGTLKKRKLLFSFGAYSLQKSDLITILKILPGNYSRLFYSPKNFIAEYKNYSARPVKNENSLKELMKWQEALNVNYLFPGEKAHLFQALNSYENKFWNSWVTLFAILVIPLLHLAVPLALVVSIIALVQKKWAHAIGLIIIVICTVSQFFLLSIIDIVVGYRATLTFYFVNSYGPILVVCFISLALLNSFCRSRLVPDKPSNKTVV